MSDGLLSILQSVVNVQAYTSRLHVDERQTP